MPKYRAHQERKMKILDESHDFVVYTYRILKKEKVFPKSSRWQGVYQIAELTGKYHTCITMANAIKVTNIPEKHERHRLQTEAYAILETMAQKFQICAEVYGLDADQFTNWVAIVGKLQSGLNAWIKSDEKRYEDIV